MKNQNEKKILCSKKGVNFSLERAYLDRKKYLVSFPAKTLLKKNTACKNPAELKQYWKRVKFSLPVVGGIFMTSTYTRVVFRSIHFSFFVKSIRCRLSFSDDALERTYLDDDTLIYS